jgi:predicted LPLAT superfamily acyltransferase
MGSLARGRGQAILGGYLGRLEAIKRVIGD